MMKNGAEAMTELSEDKIAGQVVTINALKCVNLCAQLGPEPEKRIEELLEKETYWRSLICAADIPQVDIIPGVDLTEIEERKILTQHAHKRIEELLEAEKDRDAFINSERREWEDVADAMGICIHSEPWTDTDCERDEIVKQRARELVKSEQKHAAMVEALEGLMESIAFGEEYFGGKEGSGAMRHLREELESILAAHAAPKKDKITVADIGSCDPCVKCGLCDVMESVSVTLVAMVNLIGERCNDYDTVYGAVDRAREAIMGCVLELVGAMTTAAKEPCDV